MTPTESQVQQAFFQHVFLMRQREPLWEFVISNPLQGGRGKDNERRGVQMLREGLSKGFPDISVLVPRYTWGGLFIELKLPKGKLSHEQKSWAKRLNNSGYRAITIFTDNFMEIVRKVESWFRLPEPNFVEE